jgi:hypothetical protein
MPEEYQTLNQFVDRVERGLIGKLLKARQVEEERQRVAQANVPEAAYQVTLEDMAISPRITTILGGAGYTTAGDLMLQMILDSDEILGLNGIGPKTMADIEEALANLEFEEETPELEETGAEEAPTVVIEDEGAAAEVEPGAETDLVEEIPEAIDIVAEGEIESEISVEDELAEAVQVDVDGKDIDLAAKQDEDVPLIEIPELDDEKQDTSLEEIFALRPDVLEFSGDIEEDDDDVVPDSKRKKKEKKKKYVQAEYDPDQDVVLYKRKRKRGGVDEFDDDKWDL